MMTNKMKFFSMAVLFVAAAALSSCEKETLSNVVSGTYTTTVDMAENNTKALTSGGEKAFAAGERIAVIYMNTNGDTKKAVSAALTAGDIKNNGKKAQFTVELEDPDNNAAIRYIYPASMAKATIATDATMDDAGTIDFTKLCNQNGTLDNIDSLDLCVFDAASWGGTELPANQTLTNKLAIGKFSFEESGSPINSDIKMLYIGDGTHSYYIQRPSASGDPIFVAMMPVANQYFTFHAANADGSNKYEYEVSNKTLLANKWYELEISTTKLQTGATFGKFSIDGSNTVHFSQGNLQYDQSTNTWSFMDYQWSTVETSGQNVGDDYANQNIVSLFGWSANVTNNFGISTSTSTSDYSGSFVDWGTNNITNGGGTNYWSTPSTDAWQYIFNTRSASTGRFAQAYLLGTTHGMILFPDHYTHPNDVPVPTGINLTGNTSWNGNRYTAEQWAKMEAAGAVFLPAAGSRRGTGVFDVGGSGDYWSSTADDGNCAWYVDFYENNVGPGGRYYRYVGQSVRLVCE